MSGFNLPPGVGVHDIPGNRPVRKKPSAADIQRAIRYIMDDKYGIKWSDTDIAERAKITKQAKEFLSQ